MKKWVRKLKYVLIFIIVESFTVYFLLDLFDSKEKQYLSKKTDELYIAYNAIISGHLMIAQTIFSEVINKPDVIELLKNANTANIYEQNKIREELYRKLYPSYKNLSKNNYVNFHFQLPNSVSFLRFYKPGKFGDDLSESRYSIKVVNTQKISVQSFEVGSVYHGYRFIYPLFYNNTHIGSVEIGIAGESIKKEMEKIFHSCFDFIIDENLFNKNVFSEEKTKYITCKLNDKYLIEKPEKGTNNANHICRNRIENINNSLLKEKIAENINNNRPFALNYKTKIQNYILSFLPITNFKGVKIAYLVSYVKDNTVKVYDKELTIMIILITILIMVLVFFIAYVEHSFMVIRQNKDELQSIGDNMTEGIIALDRNYKIISVNPATEKIIGLYGHELKGRYVYNIVCFRDENSVILPFEKWPFFENANYGLSYKSDSGFFVKAAQKEIPIELNVTSRFFKGDIIGTLMICKHKREK